MPEYEIYAPIAARQDSDDVAIIDVSADGKPSISYRQLHADVEAATYLLRKKGYKSGSHIALLGANSYAYVVSLFAIWRSGHVATPVNVWQSQEIVSYVLEDSAPVAVIAEDDFPLPDQLDAERFRFADLLTSDASGPGDAVQRPDELGPGIILYTSGSTGRPKGVVISHQALQHGVAAASGYFGGADLRVSIGAAPLFHMNGLTNLLITLHTGAAQALLRRFEARQYLQTVHDYRVRLVGGIPTFIAWLKAELDKGCDVDLSCVEVCILGSAPLTEAIASAVAEVFPNAELFNGYGTTEIGPACFGRHPDGVKAPFGSIGYPNAGVSLRLVGETPDEGVLWAKSPASFSHYLNLPDVTAEKVVDGWYNTGDVMRRDADGFYFFVSRADDMFVCNGENIYPAEVEKLLERHPEIVQAAVLPKTDAVRGAVPAAFIVKTPDSLLDEEAVKAFALANGAAYMHPRIIQFLDHLPLSGVGKIDKKKLAALLAA